MRWGREDISQDNVSYGSAIIGKKSMGLSKKLFIFSSHQWTPLIQMHADPVPPPISSSTSSHVSASPPVCIFPQPEGVDSGRYIKVTAGF